MDFLKGVGLLIIVLVSTYLLSIAGIPFDWYAAIIGAEKSYSDFFAGYAVLGEFLLNLIVNYVFLVSFLFLAAGLNYRYWWVVILLIPIFVFAVWAGQESIPIFLIVLVTSLVGWGIGFGVNKLVYKKQSY